MATVKDRAESAPAEAEEDVSSTLPTLNSPHPHHHPPPHSMPLTPPPPTPTLNAPHPHHHPPPHSIPLTHTTAHTHTQDDNILDTWEDLKTDESESDDVEEQPESVHCVCSVGGCDPVHVVGVINLGVERMTGCKGCQISKQEIHNCTGCGKNY